MDHSAKYCYDYPHPALTSDIVVFGYDGHELHILLIERGLEPYKGSWALPGGFMKMDETIEQCAARELREETGVEDAYLRQFHVFSSTARDPRGRVVTVAFLALVSKSEYRVIGGDDAVRAFWFPADELPPLAFDHNNIIAEARRHLRVLVATEPVILRLLDNKFSLAELQRLVEIITGQTYDRRNFQRRILQSDVLNNEGTSTEPTSSRPPTMYSIRKPMCMESNCESSEYDDDLDFFKF